MRTTDTPKSHEPRHSARHAGWLIGLALGVLIAYGIVEGIGLLVETVATAIEGVEL